MKRPSASEFLFAVKCFIAGMLALYLALQLGLARPFWGMMTSYIVASPWSGSVRSKAIYRVFGTVIGSALAVLLVPTLANAPELLALALACWVGLCLYISLLDRTPRSYVFMLAGYTAALIGFPVVGTPGIVFDVAIARVEEITLGIACATLVHSIVFPTSIGAALLARIDGAMRDGERWIEEVAGGIRADHDQHARRKLAGDITELRLMATHLPFDTSHLRWTSATIHQLQDQLALMLPILSAIEDRLLALRALDPQFLSPPWSNLFRDIADLTKRADHGVDFAQVRQQLTMLMPAIGPDASWSQLLQANLIARIELLLTAYEESLRLRREAGQITTGAALPHVAPRSISPMDALHTDRGLALMSACAAVIAIGACCAFWIATSWSSGAAAAMMAAVFCCFYATQDDPVPSIRTFTVYTLVSIPISAFYLLGVMPAIHGFEMLTLALAPVFLLLGCYAARPSTGLRAMATLIGVFGMLTLQDTGNADMATFLNSMLAQLIGMASAMIFTGLLRSVSSGWTVRRLLHRGWVELSAMGRSHQAGAENSASFVTTRMLDRIALLTPRLTVDDADTDHSAMNALGDLRIALCMAQLLDMETGLESAGVGIRPLMKQLSDHFGALQADGRNAAAHLLASLDTALRAICRVGAPAELKRALISLTSLRRDLFPAAPPFYQHTAEVKVPT